MEPDKNMRNLRDMGTYLKKALKFYDLKNERITPIIFTVILFTGFVGVFIPNPAGQVSILSIVYNAVSLAVMYLASAVYLLAYIKELRGEAYTFAGSVNSIMRRAVKIIAASIMYVTAIFAGFILLVVPGVVIYLTFLFNTCYIVDTNKGMMEAFTASRNLARGTKLEIFGLLALFNVLMMPLFLVMMATFSSNSELAFSFVLTFAATIMGLMQQRLIALLYVDLEYGEVKH